MDPIPDGGRDGSSRARSGTWLPGPGPPTFPAMSTGPDRASLRRDLLEHFDAHRRDLPWRKSREPYRVWVSEVMLQQTRVLVADPYYRRWMERFPSLDKLADADEEAVLKAWEGLGYYSRARNLHRSARIVKERWDGVLPNSARDLRELPGIGEYSAGAIASIAYGEPVPAVDGNARRVISRLFDLADPSAGELREHAAELLDRRRPGDWNQAVMELGATICLPQSPRCGECPVAEACRARASDTQEHRPLARRRGRVRKATFGVLVARRGGEFFLTRRPRGGLLGGLWEFPSMQMAGGGLRDACRAVAHGWGVELPSEEAAWRPLRPVRHAFSHLKAVYQPLLVDGASGAPPGRPVVATRRFHAEDSGCRWADPGRIASLPLSAAQRRILQLALDEPPSARAARR